MIHPSLCFAMEENEQSKQIEIPHVPTLNQYNKHLFKTSNVIQFNPRPFCDELFREEYEFHRSDPEARWKYQKEIRWRYNTNEAKQYIV